MKCLKDYHDLYLKTDVLLLAGDVVLARSVLVVSHSDFHLRIRVAFVLLNKWQKLLIFSNAAWSGLDSRDDSMGIIYRTMMMISRPRRLATCGQPMRTQARRAHRPAVHEAAQS